jgi:hypothetical protein
MPQEQATQKQKGAPMTESGNTPSLDIVIRIIEQHGCKLVDVDLDKRILNIEGPEAAQVECALALDKLLN